MSKIVDQRDVDFFKKLARDQWVLMVHSDYGEQSSEQLAFLTDAIANIYRNLQHTRFKCVTIYIALSDQCFLSKLVGANPTKYSSYENLTPLDGSEIVIEVKENGELDVSLGYNIDPDLVRNNSIIYRFEKDTESEYIFGKTSTRKLRQIPDADSYFSIQSYKELEIALEDYKTKVARFSQCTELRKAWFDDNMVFFKPKPEFILRDSLTQFLNHRLRNIEARPEQVVDKSHPVDIKVTWSLANRLALLEIKWLGKSIQTRGKRFKQIYTRQRALDGAEQLAKYLDENVKLSTTKATKGYLVVFDARRWGCNSNTIIVDKTSGLRYVNDEIIYDPEYHLTRTDFSKPIRFFLEPKFAVN